MADYNLNALSERDFEHLVQALALSTIGSAVTPFGDGPDGAREATYLGPHRPDTAGSVWNGYLVLQAKHQRRPTNDTKSTDWLLRELAREVAKFADAERGLRIPDYYIVATNLVLSPVHDTGGKDRVFAALKE